MDIAKYICEDRERLQMALHVYEAKDDVREHLIERFFRAVTGQVAEKLGIDVEEPKIELEETSVYFCNQETDEFWVFARVVSYRRPKRLLGVGVYSEEKLDQAQLGEIQERFKTHGDLETWSDGVIHPYDYEVFVHVHDENGEVRLDDVSFLIRNHDEFVSSVAERLVLTYENIVR